MEMVYNGPHIKTFDEKSVERFWIEFQKKHSNELIFNDHLYLVDFSNNILELYDFDFKHYQYCLANNIDIKILSVFACIKTLNDELLVIKRSKKVLTSKNKISLVGGYASKSEYPIYCTSDAQSFVKVEISQELGMPMKLINEANAMFNFCEYDDVKKAVYAFFDFNFKLDKEELIEYININECEVSSVSFLNNSSLMRKRVKLAPSLEIYKNKALETFNYYARVREIELNYI